MKKTDKEQADLDQHLNLKLQPEHKPLIAHRPSLAAEDLFYILHLLTHLFDQYFQINCGFGGIGNNRFR